MTTERARTYQNTYRIKPKRPFDANIVETHLKNILELNLKEFEYADQAAKDLCLTMIEEIKTEIKNENFDRYRIIVFLNIGEKKMQGVHTSHSFLWDDALDKYVTRIYETNGYFCGATVYGIYLD